MRMAVGLEYVYKELLRKQVLYAWSKDMHDKFRLIAKKLPDMVELEEYGKGGKEIDGLHTPPIARIRKVRATGSINH